MQDKQNLQTNSNKQSTCFIILFMFSLVLIPKCPNCFASGNDVIIEIPIYIVDAFTEIIFKGNPAAVCPLSEWLDDSILQSIASEINLSETAFFVRKQDICELRWFTPEVEVDLCGHGTLAAAHVLFEHLNFNNSQIVFETKSGQMTVRRENGLYLMDFPVIRVNPFNQQELLEQCLREKPLEVYTSSLMYLAVFDSEEKIKNMAPDLELMRELAIDLIVTARGLEGVDFVSRCFAPSVGIPEDPVTGSAHCVLAPFWADKMEKTTFYARQLSKRGGDIFCEYLEDRVIIGGKAVTFSTGKIMLDSDWILSSYNQRLR
jgi:PhzF family phenazine biosynthesis protein